MEKKNKDFLIKLYFIFTFPLNIIVILFAIFKVKFFKKNIKESEYQAFIKSFLVSGGWTNDLISFFLKKKIQLKSLIYDTSKEIKEISKNINNNGYYEQEKYLSAEKCDEILKFASSQRGYYEMDGLLYDQSNLLLYNRQSPLGTRFSFIQKTVLENSVVQDLVFDKKLRGIAAEYFQADPLLSAVNLWWTSGFKKDPDKQSAQYYHFDLDSPKFLKFFFYITDVTSERGPHTFIKSSHKNKGIPWSLRSKGYTRLEDHDIINHYGKDSIVEFSRPQGALIIEDTRGLHKGKNVTSGDRLILQFEFANTTFFKNMKNYLPDNLINRSEYNLKNNKYFFSLYKNNI
jgi:hypothetical protein